MQHLPPRRAAALIATLIAGVLLCLSRSTAAQTSTDQPEKPSPRTAAALERIASDIKTLQGEDTATSIKYLSDPEMFYWPGGFSRGFTVAKFPLERDTGRWDMDAIMSNRRFLKLMADLAVLPRKEAGEMVGKEIEACLPEYVKMFDAGWMGASIARAKNPNVGSAEAPAGPKLEVYNRPYHSPTLVGMRFKLLSLLLIAGDLHLTEAKEAVADATALALKQRKHFYESSEATLPDRYVMLRNTGIYNREILLTAARGVADEHAFASAGPWVVEQLTAYDAAATRYDARRGVKGPPDFSKGKIAVTFYHPLDDAQFDQAIKAK